MKIAIHGCGIAGPTLAWWLKKYGYDPVIYERAPALREGGYMIDFWGVGYDVAEKMGILPALLKRSYKMEALKIVDKNGRANAELKMQSLRNLINNRFISIPRSDVSKVIFEACADIPCHFGTSIQQVNQRQDSVELSLTNGEKENVDVVVGADGLHSVIRQQVFRNEKMFSRDMHINVAAFTVTNYEKHNPNVYVMHQGIDKQIARVTLRYNKTLFLFTFKHECIHPPKTEDEQKQRVRETFSDMRWEVPNILAMLDSTEDFYFDHVSQIRMNTWTQGRFALIGDAAACPSLLAGEGAGLAMTEAYVLAGELIKAKGDYQQAFASYEKILKPFVEDKQNRATDMVSFFAPANFWQRILLQWGISASNWPMIAKLLIGPTLTDNFTLPDYELHH